MSLPSVIASQAISSGGSVNSGSFSFTPTLASGASQNIAGGLPGSGQPVFSPVVITGQCVNPSDATPLSAPCTATLSLSVDGSHWIPVQSYTCSKAPLYTDSFTFGLTAFTGPPTSYGLAGWGNSPIAWQYFELVMGGNVGGAVTVQANQALQPVAGSAP